MTRSADIHRDDPELGRERLCRKCQEWWPEDGEFWYFQNRTWHGIRGATTTLQTVPYCKACWSERKRSGNRSMMTA